MSAFKPLSLAATATLQSVADGVRHGFDVIDATRMASGTIYPILGRLEKAGYLRSSWEAASTAQRAKRPPRRYYEITAAGKRALAVSVEHYRTLGGLFAPTRGVRRNARSDRERR
ncbi:MAG: PadR family transcriptional regulator [Gemmatimonadota bacterium]|nr:PadR family transcriptional regulator [Gemmatimonadota bacterium]